MSKIRGQGPTRIPKTQGAVERRIEKVRRLQTWTDALDGPLSLAKGAFIHPVAAFQVLRLIQSSREDASSETEDMRPVEEILSAAEARLLRAQEITRSEREIESVVFSNDDPDAYVRLSLRETRHTIRLAGKDNTITLEPRLLLHRDGVVQLSVGVHLPAGYSSADVISVSSPRARLLHSSRIPEPYAHGKTKWAGGDWSDQLEGGVRVRVFEHDEPASVNDLLEVAVRRVMRGIGASPDGVWNTYPVIMAKVGDCCADWANNHEQDIVHLAVRPVHLGEDKITMDAGPDLSIHSGMQTRARESSALILHLGAWTPGIWDLQQTMTFERTALVFVRLRQLEQRISDFRTKKGEVLRVYRAVLELEKEVRGAHYRPGSEREISQHVFRALGAYDMLESVRHGASMLGERASTRASMRGARASNRLTLFGILVAVIAAIPSIPPILELISEQRAAHPDNSIWAIIQTLTTSPLLLAATIIFAAIVYGLLQLLVISFRVARYFTDRRKQGYVSRLGQ